MPNQVEELCCVLNDSFVPLLGRHVGTDDFETSVLNALREAFVSGRQPEPPALRISSLGKPVVDQMLPLLLPSVGGFEKVVESKMAFPQALSVFNGNFIEALAVLQAKQYGFDIENEQEEVVYCGIKGHLDFTLDGFVVDVKSMSPGYFNKFTRYVKSDDRGYLTQGACYSAAKDLPFAWLLYDKSTCRWVVDYLSPKEKTIALARVDRVVPKMRQVTTVTDLLSKFKAPDEVPEVYKKEETGNMLVPPQMWYSPYKDIWYETEIGINQYGKEVTYVTRKRELKEILKLLGVKK